MKYTLLDIVQSTLASMDSDEINSITDTTEAMDIAMIVRDKYFEIVSSANLPENYKLFGLEASGDADLPTLMTLPEDIHELCWVKYDCRLETDDDPLFQPMKFVDLEEFLNRSHGLMPSDDDSVTDCTITIGTQDVTINVYNNVAPTYYTTYNDHTVLFNSYNSEVDSTLQKSKTLCYGERIIPWTMSDVFIPNLDDKQFPLLVAEVKKVAWVEKKQAQNTEAIQSAKRGWRTLGRTKRAIPPGPKGYWEFTPYYGRK